MLHGFPGRATLLSLLAGAAILAPQTVSAASISGNSGGLSWQATSTLVGIGSTATAGGGGDPNYFAGMPQYSGVAALIMDYGSAGRFICSGTLLSDRRSVLTAGHCVSNGVGTANPLKTTVYFYGGANPDTIVPTDPAATGIDVTDYFVHSAYTGEVIDQNDIAVVRLGDYAPSFATSYDIYSTTDLTGGNFNVAGYGVRSDTGGAVGGNLGTGLLRQGDNRYDFRLGDDDFGGFFDGGSSGFFGAADVEYSYVSDFDNGFGANDTACQIAGVFSVGGPKYCNTGVGALEVGVAGGDSGGPQFINGQIASITSYGLSFGTAFGDVDGNLNSTFGEFSGYVPTFIHANFINSALVPTGATVPEPATWALMISGFGLAGAALRRRRQALHRI